MPLYGIDLSEHHADAPLDRMDYAILGLKATEGKGYRDSAMVRLSDLNRRSHNRDEVYYHFISTGNSAEEEARNFIDTVKSRLRPQDCICLDWERAGGGRPTYDLAWAQRWMQIVEAELGKRPWIYVGLPNADIFRGSDIAAHNPAWLPHYGDRARTGGYADRPDVDLRGKHPFSRVVGWQFTEAGHIAPYGDGIDLNEFYIEPGKMVDWAGNRATPPVTREAVRPEVEGRIGERWRETGHLLGSPTGPEVQTERGAWRPFEGGCWLWSPGADAHPSCGAIREAYARHDFEHGPLGYPITDEQKCPDGVGVWQGYEGGSIYWHPQHGAHVVWGAIRDKWGSMGWEAGALGYPTTDEFDGLKQPGRVQDFQRGTLYWHPAQGCWPVWGLMKAEYGKNGYEGGPWGYPGGPENPAGNMAWAQGFEGGIKTVTAQRPAIPRIAENDTKRWIRMRGGEGWGCICMELVLPRVEDEMRRRGLIRDCIDVFQMGYNAGGVAASAGTHDMGGVIDVAQGISWDERKVWADFGVMMAPRTAAWGWNGDEHAHGGWYGCVHRTASLAKQVKDMMNGYDGLVSNRYVNWEKPQRTWQDALRAL